MKLGLLSAAMLFVASNAMAQHAHSPVSPSETGQSQFAAIAEIVTLLRDDPDTDWAQVDNVNEFISIIWVIWWKRVRCVEVIENAYQTISVTFI